MIIENSKVEAVKVSEGFQRKILARGGSMMATEMIFKKGSMGAIHSHPHEQLSYVLSGSLEVTLGSEKYIVKAGDSYYIEPDLKHGSVALEDSVIYEVFTPQRQDFLK